MGKDTRQTAAPKNGETDKWIQGVMAYHSRNSQMEDSGGNLGCGRKTWIVNDKVIEAQCGQAWDLKTPGDSVIGVPYNIMRFTSRNSTNLSIYQRKIPSCFHAPSKGEGKEPFWNMPEHSVLLDKTFPQGKLVNHSLTCWDIIRA